MKEEKIDNAKSVTKSITSRFIFRMVMYIVLFIVARFIAIFMFNDANPDGSTGQASLALLKIIIIFSLVVVAISFAYQIFIIPRKEIYG